jgi:hypothetical protein
MKLLPLPDTKKGRGLHSFGFGATQNIKIKFKEITKTKHLNERGIHISWSLILFLYVDDVCTTSSVVQWSEFRTPNSEVLG